jgi:Raf kinase inhibitor-like YbhB/YbcL family protein
MKKVFKHLLWVVPLILLITVVSLAGSAANARDADRTYHSNIQNSIRVSSRNFQPEQEIPVEFSCKGRATSPHILWDNVPSGARSYVLVMMDWDAPFPNLRLFAVVHWVLYNISQDVREIPQGVSGEELADRRIEAGLNMGGQPGYVAPCPPFGMHRYEFRVYALDVDQIQPASGTKADIMKAMEGHILAYGELAGLRRP